MLRCTCEGIAHITLARHFLVLSHKADGHLVHTGRGTYNIRNPQHRHLQPPSSGISGVLGWRCCPSTSAHHLPQREKPAFSGEGLAQRANVRARTPQHHVSSSHKYLPSVVKNSMVIVSPLSVGLFLLPKWPFYGLYTRVILTTYYIEHWVSHETYSFNDADR